MLMLNNNRFISFLLLCFFVIILIFILLANILFTNQQTQDIENIYLQEEIN